MTEYAYLQLTDLDDGAELGILRVPVDIVEKIDEFLDDVRGCKRGIRTEELNIQTCETLQQVLEVLQATHPVEEEDDDCGYCQGTGIGNPHADTRCSVCGGSGVTRAEPECEEPDERIPDTLPPGWEP